MRTLSSLAACFLAMALVMLATGLASTPGLGQ